MIVNTRLIILAAIVTLVSGQTQCIISCSTAALGSVTNKSCTSFQNKCVCTDVGFQTAAGQCLQKNCTTQDQQTAAQLAKVLCGSSTGSGSSNSTGGTNSTSSVYQSSTGSSSATGSAATTSQSSAAGAQIQGGQNGFFALGITAAGAIVGGLLI